MPHKLPCAEVEENPKLLYLEPGSEEKDGKLYEKGVQKAAYTGPNKMVRVQQIRIINQTRCCFSHTTNDITSEGCYARHMFCIHNAQGIKHMVVMDGCSDFLSK